MIENETRMGMVLEERYWPNHLIVSDIGREEMENSLHPLQFHPLAEKGTAEFTND